MNAKQLVEVIEEAGFEARSYSGRAMYGRDCVGVELDRGDSGFSLAAKLCAAAPDCLSEEDALDFVDGLSRLDVREDSMGLGGIVYFPRVDWPEDLSPDGEEDEDEEHDCEGPSCCTPVEKVA